MVSSSFSYYSQICENRLTSAQQQKSCLESLLTNESLLTASLQTLRPEFLRLAPPLLSCPQAAAPPSEGGGGGGLASCSPDSPELWAEELAWLCPSTVEHSFHWDASMGQSDAAEEVSSYLTGGDRGCISVDSHDFSQAEGRRSRCGWQGCCRAWLKQPQKDSYIFTNGILKLVPIASKSYQLNLIRKQ